MTEPKSIVISAEALRARLGEPGLLLVDTRDRAAWRKATLPGAVHLDVYDYFIPRSDAAGLADLQRAAWAGLTAVGADKARTVVFFETATGMISPRGLWFHEHAGLGGGLILDGGYEAWVAAGGPVAPGTGADAAITGGAAGPAPPAPRADLYAGVDDILAREPGTVVLDVRRPTEHTGSFVHPCCARPGRIPDSVLLFYEDLLADGRYRAPDEIAARARAAGLTPETPVIIYCHRGARAATALYGLRLAGFAGDGRVFVGSWHEWAERGELFAATGVEEDPLP
ncbi:sulfurtransferase [Prosthecomicrobium sp. N25]|uniref:sulfurtransferase n=1 Tax=Prosthecomicrobium sp. N25 TaxID=3129254 RepID=UPI00307837D3